MKKTLITLALALTTTAAFAQMDHGHMKHENMNHGSMEMDHSKMDHSNMMDMPGMSAVGIACKRGKAKQSGTRYLR